MQRYWHWIGALIGVSVGFSEVWFLSGMGVRMTMNGREMSAFVSALFELSFAVVGYLVGRLMQTRATLRADAATIRAQLTEIERTKALVVHHERMAVIGRLAAGIAHEVRNPLGVIRASASMLRENASSDGDAARACRFIQEETDRLDAFIATLLTFAKPTDLRIRPCRPGDVVARAVDLSTEAARRGGASVTCRTGDTRPFEADPDLVTQVLLNLLVNAVEAAGRGGHVLVATEPGPSGVVFRVADDGPGVSPDAETRLFEPFFTTKATGTGLGLSMAAHVVAAHGGALEHVHGAGLGPNGRGACFTLTLPGLAAARSA